MIITMVFCICVMALCCYSVHMLLQDRMKLQNEIYKELVSVDKAALATQLKITMKYEHIINAQKPSDYEIADADIINITPMKKRNPDNAYPIRPSNRLGMGYGFDLRV